MCVKPTCGTKCRCVVCARKEELIATGSVFAAASTLCRLYGGSSPLTPGEREEVLWAGAFLYDLARAIVSDKGTSAPPTP